MFNVFLTIFLFLALGWLTVLILSIATKVIALEKKISDVEASISTLAKALDSMGQSMRSTNDILSVQAKTTSDFLTDLASFLSQINEETTSKKGAKRPKKNKEEQIKIMY